LGIKKKVTRPLGINENFTTAALGCPGTTTAIKAPSKVLMMIQTGTATKTFLRGSEKQNKNRSGVHFSPAKEKKTNQAENAELYF